MPGCTGNDKEGDAKGIARMSSIFSELERMRRARQKLARARQRVRRLSWMAREPESLDAQVPLLKLQAFLRALARFQAIRLPDEDAALLALRVEPCPPPLRRAIAMHLIEGTRNCDTLGCAGEDAFLVLLKGADDAGAQAAARRLHAELRQLAAQHGHMVRVHTRALSISQRFEACDVLHLLDANDKVEADSSTVLPGECRQSQGHPAS